MAHLHEHVQFGTVNDSEFDYNSVGLTLAEFVVLRVAVHPWIDDEVRKLLFLALNEITASSVLNAFMRVSGQLKIALFLLQKPQEWAM